MFKGLEASRQIISYQEYCTYKARKCGLSLNPIMPAVVNCSLCLALIFSIFHKLLNKQSREYLNLNQKPMIFLDARL